MLDMQTLTTPFEDSGTCHTLGLSGRGGPCLIVEVASSDAWPCRRLQGPASGTRSAVASSPLSHRSSGLWKCGLRRGDTSRSLSDIAVVKAGPAATFRDNRRQNFGIRIGECCGVARGRQGLAAATASAQGHVGNLVMDVLCEAITRCGHSWTPALIRFTKPERAL